MTVWHTGVRVAVLLSSQEEDYGLMEKFGADVKITWPSKKSQVQEINNMEIDKAYFIKEGEEAKLINYQHVPFKRGQQNHHH